MPYKGAPGDMIWVDELADPWGPTGRYGKSIPQQLTLDRAVLDSMWREIVDLQFNTEGEQKMQKIDWSKPIRGAVTGDKYEVMGKATIVGEHGQSVMILDDYGRQVGNPRIATNNPQVENTPKEEFLVGLARDPDGTYWLTDDGEVSDMGTMNYWKKFMGDRPHWIVDTRKPAEPPEAVEYDPKDWAVVTVVGEQRTVSTDLLTQYRATKMAADHGGVIVRVRTTPPPADTARYIQLYRTNAGGSWKINAHCPALGGGQEFTWDETKDRGVNSWQTAIKVRD